MRKIKRKDKPAPMTHVLTVKLDDATVEVLERWAARLGVSKAEVIRQSIKRYEGGIT